MSGTSIEKKELLRTAAECYRSELAALLSLMLPPDLHDGATQRPSSARCVPLALGVLLATRFPGPDALALAGELFEAACSAQCDVHPTMVDVWERLDATIRTTRKQGGAA